MLKALWRNWQERREARRALEELRRGLRIPDERRDLGRVCPIIVPGMKGELLNNWPGPIAAMDGTSLAIAWAEVRKAKAGGNAWSYVSKSLAKLWEEEGIDWRRTAFQNLRRSSIPGANGEKLDDD